MTNIVRLPSVARVDEEVDGEEEGLRFRGAGPGVWTYGGGGGEVAEGDGVEVVWGRGVDGGF